METPYIPRSSFTPASLLETLGEGVPTGQPSPDHPNVPEDLRIYWREIGLRSWLDGFVWLTNPSDFEPVILAWNRKLVNHAVFARTGLGDLFVWKSGAVLLANVANRSIMPLTDDLPLVLHGYLGRPEFRDRVLRYADYRNARVRLPELGVDECYGYVPHPKLGGPGTPDSLQLVKTVPYLEMVYKL